MRFAIVAVTAVGLCAAQDASDPEKLLSGAKMTLGEALEKALKEAKSGTAVKAVLEEDENGIVFSFDIAQGKNVLAINLDAKTAKVVGSDLEEGNDQSALAGGKITLAQAIETALKGGGKAVEAFMKPDGERLLAVVEVFDGKKSQQVVVDAKTGKVVGGQDEGAAYTDTFEIDPADWSSTGANRYFILEPGFTLELEGKEGGKTLRLVITVLDETKKVQGVETRVVEERETLGDELVEVSRNWFAISKRTSSVYYFGEDVDIYKDGKVVSHGGAWISGEKGARFGLMMAGTALLGSRYYQEVAPEVAMDRSEIVSLSEKVETPAGTFEKCLKTLETTPLEKAAKDYKLYAPGIGLIVDGAARLVKHGNTKKKP